MTFSIKKRAVAALQHPLKPLVDRAVEEARKDLWQEHTGHHLDYSPERLVKRLRQTLEHACHGRSDVVSAGACLNDRTLCVTLAYFGQGRDALRECAFHYDLG